MKHIKMYERYSKIQYVYWIVPFDSNKFEDSLVQLMSQYHSNYDPADYLQKIELINVALGIAQYARKKLPEDQFVIVTMDFKIENTEIVYGPIFNVYPDMGSNEYPWDKQYLESKYIYMGFFNTNKEDYDIYKKAKKYNL